MQLTGIADRIALVTGAGGGIGAAVTRLLCADGACVVATDIDANALDALGDCATVHRVALDVRDSGAVDALIADIEQTHGPIDMGINVAGVLRTGLVTDTDDADWQALFDINAGGVFHVCRALARHMIARRRGHIVTVSSNAAGIPRHGMAAYAASKAAATLFTRSLGLELAEYGIRCNVVAPGSTRTPMQTGMWQDADGEAQVIRGAQATYKAGIPLGRIAEPEDIAQTVLFLLSDQSRHMTMANLYVDGGATQVG